MRNPPGLASTNNDATEIRRDDCGGTACRLGACPHCLIVWGIVAVFLIGKAVWEVLR